MLSKTSIFGINNNAGSAVMVTSDVVNCFQKRVSLVSTTTVIPVTLTTSSLWIAFKNEYLWYQQQLSLNIRLPQLVVNCFQKRVSLVSTTTRKFYRSAEGLLWIAFKNEYLWYQQQPKILLLLLLTRCELLSKTSIFGINNNKAYWYITI